MSHAHHCVQIVPIFNHLDEDSQSLIASKAQHQHFTKGEYIYYAGDVSDALYIIHQGMVRVFHMAEDGKEQLTRILMPGDYLGEWTLFHPEEVHSNYAQALETSQICMIHRHDFQAILDQYPQIARKLLSSLSYRLQEADQHTAQLSTQSTTSRLALFLANQTVVQRSVQGSLIHLHLSKKDIASYLGMSPETLSRALKRLEESGYIHVTSSKEILIPDIDRLLFVTD